MGRLTGRAGRAAPPATAIAAPAADAARASPPWRTEAADGTLTLALHVQPGAKRTEPAGAHGAALKLRLAAPPVEGRANAALLRFLADAFGVALRDVALLRGETSREKLVRIAAPKLRPDRSW